MNSSPADIAEVSGPVVTVISATPTVPAGEVAVSLLRRGVVRNVRRRVRSEVHARRGVEARSRDHHGGPAAGLPDVGLMLVTLGRKVNWSSDDVAEVSPEVVTVTSSTPAPAGEVAVSGRRRRIEETSRLPTNPKSTVDPLPKPAPLIVTVVPPPAGPEAGLTPVTAGR